ALGEERMRERVGSVAEQADLEQRPLRAAEHEAHADDEHHRQQQREHERLPVAQELEIARVQHREEAAHHGRSSLPVSSRNRSSRLPGRIRRWPSGTRASSSVRSVASRSWVLISTRSLASMMLSGSSRAAGGNSWRGSSSSTSAKCSCRSRCCWPPEGLRASRRASFSRAHRRTSSSTSSPWAYSPLNSAIDWRTVRKSCSAVLWKSMPASSRKRAPSGSPR